MKTDSKLVEFAAKLHIAEKLAVELGTDIESAVAKHNAAIDAILNPEVPNNDDLDPEQVNGLDVVGRRENESIATLDRELSSLRALADVVPKAIKLVDSIAEQAEIFEVSANADFEKAQAKVRLLVEKMGHEGPRVDVLVNTAPVIRDARNRAQHSADRRRYATTRKNELETEDLQGQILAEVQRVIDSQLAAA